MRNPKWHRDEILLALDLYFDKDRGSIDAKNPKIIELSGILNKLPIFEIKPDKSTFRNPNGVSLKFSNFLSIDPSYKGKGMESYSKLDREIFEEYYPRQKELRNLALEIKSIAKNPILSKEVAQIEEDEISENDSAKEGQVLYKMHKVRERDRKISSLKKKSVLKSTGKLECEACGFDFRLKYGDVGIGFIECHHIVPLSNFESSKVTKLDDLALVCSNCHRMLHKGISISDIKNIFKMI